MEKQTLNYFNAQNDTVADPTNPNQYAGSNPLIGKGQSNLISVFPHS